MESKGNYIYVPDDFYLNPDLFVVPDRYNGFIETVLITRGSVQDRTKKLAQDVVRDFPNEPIVFICVLRGAFMFFKSLVDKAHKATKGNFSHSIEFIRAKSYTNDVQLDVTVEGLSSLSLEGKNVVIVEDMVDSGRTLAAVTEIIRQKSPKNLKVCVLVFKRNTKNVNIVPDYIGFSIPDKWIIGHNMDYNGHFRDLPHISVLNDEGKVHFRE